MRGRCRWWAAGGRSGPALWMKRGPGCSARPTSYLLSRPAVRSGQLVQRRPGGELMVFERRAAGPRDVEEADVAVEEALDGDLVGGVEDRAARPAAARHLKA